jgi:hypothetical protein
MRGGMFARHEEALHLPRGRNTVEIDPPHNCAADELMPIYLAGTTEQQDRAHQFQDAQRRVHIDRKRASPQIGGAAHSSLFSGGQLRRN